MYEFSKNAILTNIEKKQRQAEMSWFKWPKRDSYYQWWWGYRKVRMVILPDEEKQLLLNKHRTGKNSE